MSSPVLKYIKKDEFPDDPALISGRLTLQTYAIYCSVPQDFLSHTFFIRDGAKGGLDIPYGRDLPVKHRVRFKPIEEDYKNDQRFYWDKGAKIKGLLYGIEQLHLFDYKLEGFDERQPWRGDMLLVEGESDVHVAAWCGVPALGVPGAKVFGEEAQLRFLEHYQRIFVIHEPGDAGDWLIDAVKYSSIAPRAYEIVIDSDKDLRALWRRFRPEKSNFRQAISDLKQRAIPIGEPDLTGNNRGKNWVNGADVIPTDVEYLWPDRFVANAVNIIAGMGDVGKDVFCCYVAACVTTGRDWPDGAKGCEPGVVAIVAPEDNIANTIVPRLIAAGADMKRVHIWGSGQRPRMTDIVGCKLLIVSPLIGMLDPKKDMNKEQDAREWLASLKWALEERQITVLGTAHLNKKTDLQAAQRVLGASGIVNFVRSNWMVARDKDDRRLRLLMRMKANLSPDTTTGLTYIIKKNGELSQSIVAEFTGTTTRHPDDGDSKKPSAAKWLMQFLHDAGEPILMKDVLEAAKAAGHNESAIKKAKTRDKDVIFDKKDAFGGPSYWYVEHALF